MPFLHATALQVNRQGRAGCGQNLGSTLPLPGTKVASQPPQMQKRRMITKGYPCCGASHDYCLGNVCPRLPPGPGQHTGTAEHPFHLQTGLCAGPSVLGNAPVFADSHLNQIAAWQAEVSGFWSVISSISWCNRLERVLPEMCLAHLLLL